MTLSSIVHLEDGQPITTSFLVAEHFKKEHKDVLRAIRNLDCTSGFHERNFALCHKINELQNRKPQPYYQITRDGFSFLCMGFTGKEAAIWKESYLNAFNAMEQALTSRDELREQLIFDLKEKVLRHDPRLFKILRLKAVGLSHVEIARVVEMSASWVDRRVLELKKLDLMAEQSSQMALGV